MISSSLLRTRRLSKQYCLRRHFSFIPYFFTTPIDATCSPVIHYSCTQRTLPTVWPALSPLAVQPPGSATAARGVWLTRRGRPVPSDLDRASHPSCPIDQRFLARNLHRSAGPPSRKDSCTPATAVSRGEPPHISSTMPVKPSRVVQTSPLLCGSRSSSGGQDGAVAKPAAVLALRGEPKSDSRQGEASGSSRRLHC